MKHYTGLMAVLKGMAEHSANNPTHGYNCACKDKYLHQTRTWVNSLSDGELAELPYLLFHVQRQGAYERAHRAYRKQSL